VITPTAGQHRQQGNDEMEVADLSVLLNYELEGGGLLQLLNYQLQGGGLRRHDNHSIESEEIPARRPESEYNYGSVLRNHLSAKSFQFELFF